ncbi:hypothetical protein DNTS_032896 [Danionella cerebrum]|nr:hypothetical protein DNTS_032896 [Danionella translucida]
MLLLLCVRGAFQTDPVLLFVCGRRGGNVTLPCQSELREITALSFERTSGNIPLCETEEGCSGRARKRGTCDVLITDLIFSDAGRYSALIYHRDDESELQRVMRTYHLQVHEERLAEAGRPLELEVLLAGADQVQHQDESGSERKQIWRRNTRIQKDGVEIRDERLIISSFTAADAGEYTVLEDDGEMLISVSVRASEETLKEAGNKITILHKVLGNYARAATDLVHWSLSYNFKSTNRKLPADGITED